MNIKKQGKETKQGKNNFFEEIRFGNWSQKVRKQIFMVKYEKQSKKLQCNK